MPRQNSVLIVDDEAFIRVLLAQTLEELEDHGVKLLQAGDGEEGLSLALEHHPTLVFLDVMMPKLSGFELCNRIKAAHPDIYTIMLTAKGQAIDKKLGAAAGADEYITKPFDPDYILERAATILGIAQR